MASRPRCSVRGDLRARAARRVAAAAPGPTLVRTGSGRGGSPTVPLVPIWAPPRALTPHRSSADAQTALASWPRWSRRCRACPFCLGGWWISMARRRGGDQSEWSHSSSSCSAAAATRRAARLPSQPPHQSRPRRRCARLVVQHGRSECCACCTCPRAAVDSASRCCHPSRSDCCAPSTRRLAARRARPASRPSPSASCASAWCTTAGAALGSGGTTSSACRRGAGPRRVPAASPTCDTSRWQTSHACASCCRAASRCARGRTDPTARVGASCYNTNARGGATGMAKSRAKGLDDPGEVLGVLGGSRLAHALGRCPRPLARAPTPRTSPC